MWRPSTSQQATNGNGERNIDKGNKEYAAAFTQGDLALPPSQKYAVCMCN
jgi:carbonic anhydrase